MTPFHPLYTPFLTRAQGRVTVKTINNSITLYLYREKLRFREARVAHCRKAGTGTGPVLQHVGISRRDGAGDRLPDCDGAHGGNGPEEEPDCPGRLPNRYEGWRSRHTDAFLPLFYPLDSGLGHAGPTGQTFFTQQTSVDGNNMLQLHDIFPKMGTEKIRCFHNFISICFNI